MSIKKTIKDNSKNTLCGWKNAYRISNLKEKEGEVERQLTSM